MGPNHLVVVLFVVSCYKLSLSHGDVHYTEYNYGTSYPVGTRAHHSYEDGFKREGGQTRTCKSTAAWSGSPPTCEKKSNVLNIQYTKEIMFQLMVLV